MPTSWITHEKGIYEYRDRKREKPFLWRQTIRGEKISMSFATLEAAKAAKSSKLAQIKRYGDLAVQFSESDWRELSAARELLPEGVSIVDAARYYAERNGKVGGSTVSDSVDRFLEHQQSRGNGRKHFKNLKSRLLYLVAEYGDLPVGDVTQEMVAGLLKQISERWKPRTVLNYRSDWHNFFSYLVDLNEVPANPVSSITKRHLPKVKSVSRRNPLELWQVVEIMALCCKKHPKLAYWMALQFFVGFRESEASRFRHEWVQPEMRRIVIPGWYYDGGEERQGTKTEDDWVIDKVPENFWYWHAKYGKPEGRVKSPRSWFDWHHTIRRSIVKAGIVDTWPHNAKRDSFCTYHISAFRNPQQTALILKHRNVNTLWQSYMGSLRTEVEGRAYFQIYPGCERIVNNF